MSKCRNTLYIIAGLGAILAFSIQVKAQTADSSTTTSCSGPTVHCSKPMGGYSVAVGNTHSDDPNSPLYSMADTFTAFTEKFQDSRNFFGKYVFENPGAQGSNSCYFGTLPQHPMVTGGQWEVGFILQIGFQVGGNQWGWDYVGLGSQTIDYIRQYGPPHGVQLPCAYIWSQNMLIYACDNGGSTIYEWNNVLYTDISDTNVINSRQGVQASTGY